MNDSELLRLLKEKSPEELSADEIELLRSRLAESAELRQELAGRLRVEQSLAATLGRINISAEQLIAAASPVAPRRRRGAALALLAIAAAAGALFYYFGPLGSPYRPVAVAPLATSAATSPEDQPNGTADEPTKTPTKAGADDPDETPKNAGHDAAQTPGGSAATDAASAASPTAASASAARPPPRLVIEAEKFVRGSVERATEQIDGRATTYIYGSGKRGGELFAEYDLQIPEAGLYDLNFRFATSDSASVRISINGDRNDKVPVRQKRPKNNRPAPEYQSPGAFTFRRGKNVLRLDVHSDRFPKLDRIEIEFASHLYDPAEPEPTSGGDVVRQPVEPAPWQAALDAEKPPRFADVCFETFDIYKSLPTRDSLQRWFEPTTGHPTKIVEEKKTTLNRTYFDGVLRLRAPIDGRTSLRMSLEDYSKLQIHCYRGDAGVTFQYFEDDGYRWAAYATTRSAGGVVPQSWALAATDDGRGRRSELRFGGPFELRHHEGEMVLSRGDVVLLRAPLAEPPDDLFLQGKATFFGVSLLRTADFPLERPAPPAVVADWERPAELPWIERPGEGALFQKSEDGGMRMTADGAKTAGFVALPLPAGGPYEVVLQLSDVTPGVAVFLAPDEKSLGPVVRFTRVDKSDAVMLTPDIAEARASKVILYQPINYRCVPVVGSSCWLRLVVGCGQMRWWMSVDGRNWAEAGASTPMVVGPRVVGLHHVADVATCRATLRRVTVRKLEAVADLLDEKLADQAVVVGEATTVEQWQSAVDARRPPEVDAEAWRRACLVRGLIEGRMPAWAQPLVQTLMSQVANDSSPLEGKLRLFDQTLDLLALRDNQKLVQSLARCYLDAGWQAFEQDGTRPFSAVRRRVISAPLGALAGVAISDPRSVRVELLQLIHASQWHETLEFCRQLRYFVLNEETKLFDWAESLARREIPPQEAGDREAPVNPKRRPVRRPYGRGDSLARQRAAWSSLLVEELSKETYNALAELQAVLDSDAYDDAAQMVASFDPNVVQGVAPTVTDERLLVSLPAAIRLSIDTNPKLRQSLETRFGALAQLRVRQAIAIGNTGGVELAIEQFPTTEAAAEARRWLGDRSLADGRFGQALTLYQQALSTAGPALRQELQTRERFAAALLGKDVGTPASQNVSFGERLMSAGEFETIVKDVRTRGAVDPSHAAPVAVRISAPSPGGLEMKARAKLEAPFGETPQEEGVRDMNRLQVDWAGRQLAAVVDQELLLVSNRFQISAFDLGKDGQRRWQSQSPPGKARKARDWPLVPMQPLVVGPRIVARQLFGDGPTVACFQKEDGKLVWSTESPKDALFASDPIAAHGKLLIVLVTRPDPQGCVVRLGTLDSDTGELLSAVELARLSAVWHVRRACETTVVDDTLVIALGGAAICCDLSGDVRWIRRQVAPPADEEPEWIQQHFQPPQLIGERLLVVQPGVRAIECLDPTTGRLHWSRFVPDLHRLLGAADGRVVATTGNGLAAFDLETGSPRWRHAATGLTTAQFAPDSQRIAFVQTVAAEAKPTEQTARVVWLDLRSGAVVATTPVKNWQAADARLGPLVAGKGRLWTFAGRGQSDPARELMELVPTK